MAKSVLTQKQIDQTNADLVHYNGEFKKIVNTFYSGRIEAPDSDRKEVAEEYNEALYNRMNKAWKQMVVLANKNNRYLGLKHDAFEKTIEKNHYVLLVGAKEPRLPVEFLAMLDLPILKGLLESEEHRITAVIDYEHCMDVMKAEMVAAKKAENKETLKKAGRIITGFFK